MVKRKKGSDSVDGIVTRAMRGDAAPSWEEFAKTAAQFLAKDIPRLARLDMAARRDEVLRLLQVVVYRNGEYLIELLSNAMCRDDIKHALDADLHRRILKNSQATGRQGAVMRKKNVASAGLKQFATAQTDLTNRHAPMQRARLIVERARAREPSLLNDLKNPVDLLYRHFLSVDRDARERAPSV